jgi:hypothetical protein
MANPRRTQKTAGELEEILAERTRLLPEFAPAGMPARMITVNGTPPDWDATWVAQPISDNADRRGRFHIIVMDMRVEFDLKD